MTRIHVPFDRIAILSVALVVCGLTYAYAIHMQRPIVFDELGLHNPVYVFYKTGRMTYPMHGHPDYMVVHPPTHYATVGLLMKAGLPLFAAAGLPLVALTSVLAIVVVTGGFPLPVGAGLLLGYFAALTTWSEFYTLRPDLHVSAAWFTGLVTLESARIRGWSAWRLCVGSALAVLAATLHYWGIAALLLPVCYVAVLLWQRGFRGSWRPTIAAVCGACSIGLPYLFLFVIPLYQPILSMVGAVQGNGTPMDAFVRHLASYDAFSQRLAATYHVRWLSSVLASPALLLGIPAVFLAAPILWLTGLRVFAIAGAFLPLFVLFMSQGKQIGYTGYITPEFALLFAAFLTGFLVLFDRFRPTRFRRSLWTGGAVGLVTILAGIGVPTSMGNAWAWTNRLDALDVLRGASQRVLGQGTVVAVTSAGVWYTGGGRYVWNAFDQLVGANRRGTDLAPFIKSVDAFVLDTNWWNGRDDLAPLGTWYIERRLHLKGFVLPRSNPLWANVHLFLSSDRQQVRGVLIDDGRAREFVERSTGSDTVAILACSDTPDVSRFAQAYYRFAFAYNRQPAATSPSLVVLAMPAAAAHEVEKTLPSTCFVRDRVHGTLTPLDLNALRADPATEPTIETFITWEQAMEAKTRDVQILKNTSLAKKVREALASDAALGKIPFEVSADDGTVVLRSDQTNREERVRAVEIAHSVEGVRQVEDYMR